MAAPDYQTMMLPLLRMFNEGQTRVSDCIPGLISHFKLSEEDAAELLPSGQLLISNRANWARTYMGKAGLLTSPKPGLHEITDLGRKFLATQPTELNNKTLQQFDAFADWRLAYKKEAEEKEYVPDGPALSVDQTPEDAMQAADKILQSALRDDLLAILYDMNPIRFERLILDLLSAMGYGKGDLANSHMTKASGDGGIDGIIFEDALGLDAVYIQAKRYAPENKISRPAIQQFVGSLNGEGATKGVFVTTSDFSAEARGFLGKVQHRVVLINGQELARLMIKYGIGVRARTTYVIKSVDEDYFGEA
ncbi:restriction system protein [Pseudorhodobacter antarcticus]|uniref:Restriction system protein n=1 Tax=Pseudorhodobacter antarcticus TaxID=1077947 RepID=A0A1H8DZL6_9RHOB|nr:restriction endonuclease [Pseudorhodobacter antarcticus]SEN12643.1 restriction system protein [Pseudorhodobacter antarcticus]